MATSMSSLDVDTTIGLSNITINTTTNVTETGLLPQCKLFLFIFYAVAMGVMCFVGFVGNSVSFLVLHRDRSTPVASFLLKSLAVADNTFLILWVVQYSVRYTRMFLHMEKSAMWLFMRVYTFPVLYIAQTLTIWLTVVIALNRFMAVCVPYKAPHLCNINNVYKEVLVVTFFSILYNLPRFFELEITRDSSSEVSWNRTALGRDDVYKTVYTDVLYYLFSFILPLIILTFVNTRVIIAYQATQRRKRRMSTRRSDSENNITLVMIMVVVIFMLCQAPARIYQMVWGYTYTHCLHVTYYIIHITNTLEVLNSSVNFLIYIIFHKRFRGILAQTYCCSGLGIISRDSMRNTTTEGLSLEEARASSKRSTERSPKGVTNGRASNKVQLECVTEVQSHNQPSTKSVCVGTTGTEQAIDKQASDEQVLATETEVLLSRSDEQEQKVNENADEKVDDVTFEGCVDDEVNQPLTDCQ